MSTPVLFSRFQYPHKPDSPAALLLVVAVHIALAWLVLHNRTDARVIGPSHSLQVSLLMQESAQPGVSKPVTRPAAVLQPPPRLLAEHQHTHADSMPSPQAVSPPAGAALKQDTPAQAATAPAASTGVTQPQFDAAYLENPVPAYPVLSRRLREEGQVMLRVFVSAEGVPDRIELRQSSGYSRLDAAAREVVRQWRFIPARQGETSVSAWVLVPISFSLRS
jgi:protein TonB